MTKITDLSQLDLNGTYSYADYLNWALDETVELIKGKIQLMSPAPNVRHQRISRRLSSSIDTFLRGKSCELFVAPFDVRLYDRKKSLLASKDIYTVVQPDLCVICDISKLDTQGCNGAPNWVIEILSLGNSKKEVNIKHKLYQESGIIEYWLIFPYEEVIQQFVLNEQTETYQLLNSYSGDDQASPHLFPDLIIDLTKLFEAL